jgi:hypothetical protein
VGSACLVVLDFSQALISSFDIENRHLDAKHPDHLQVAAPQLLTGRDPL